ncbi:YceI family protein [Roseovarius sp. CAU 1744]|uniref:YceI family protein n=1 Tax=Roseovarius sp. CAU 1744 TaxID=3140368 RepID=UPI00325B797A
MFRTLAFALAASTALATAATAEQVEWTLDLGHAHIGWEIDHFNVANTVGRFNDFDGTFMIDEADPSNSQISYTIQAASVDSNHLGRDNHIRQADYLNVEAFPEITFPSTEVQMLTPTTGILTGDLEMLGVMASGGAFTLPGTPTFRGVIHPVALSGTIVIKGDTATVAAATTFECALFQTDNGQNAVAQEAHVRVNLVATRAKGTNPLNERITS